MVITYEHEGKTYIKGELLPQRPADRLLWLSKNRGTAVIYTGGAICSGGATPEGSGTEPGVYRINSNAVNQWNLACCDDTDMGGDAWRGCHAGHFSHAVEYNPTTEDLEAVWE